MKLILKTKYLKFHKAKKQNPKTMVYLVRTNDMRGILLGEIRWYVQWRQYGFYPVDGTVFEKTCLADLSDFCNKLNFYQRKLRNRRKNE